MFIIKYFFYCWFSINIREREIMNDVCWLGSLNHFSQTSHWCVRACTREKVIISLAAYMLGKLLNHLCGCTRQMSSNCISLFLRFFCHHHRLRVRFRLLLLFFCGSLIFVVAQRFLKCCAAQVICMPIDMNTLVRLIIQFDAFSKWYFRSANEIFNHYVQCSYRSWYRCIVN